MKTETNAASPRHAPDRCTFAGFRISFIHNFTGDKCSGIKYLFYGEIVFSRQGGGGFDFTAFDRLDIVRVQVQGTPTGVANTYLVWSTLPGCIHDRAAASCDEERGSSLRLVTGPRGWWWWWWWCKLCSWWWWRPNMRPPGGMALAAPPGPGYSLRPHTTGSRSTGAKAAGHGEAVLYARLSTASSDRVFTNSDTTDSRQSIATWCASFRLWSPTLSMVTAAFPNGRAIDCVPRGIGTPHAGILVAGLARLNNPRPRSPTIWRLLSTEN